MRKVKYWIWLLLLLPAGCIVYHDGGDVDVRYLVLGAADRVEVAYLDEQADTVRTSVPIGWTYAFTATDGRPLFLRAVLSQPGDEVTVIIEADGRLVDAADARGAGATATASGTAS